jgi:hypothetical protein
VSRYVVARCAVRCDVAAHREVACGVRSLPVCQRCARSFASQVTDGRSVRALRPPMGIERISRRTARRSLAIDARSVRTMSRHDRDRSPFGTLCWPAGAYRKTHGVHQQPVASYVTAHHKSRSRIERHR